MFTSLMRKLKIIPFNLGWGWSWPTNEYMANYSVNDSFAKLREQYQNTKMNSPGTPSAPQRKSICGIIVHLRAQPSESNLSSLDCKNLAHHPQIPQIPGIVIAYPLSCQDCHDHRSASPVSFWCVVCMRQDLWH